MESFFLSETLKYLYLLFDEDNVLHTSVKDHILTTQAHVLPLSKRFRGNLKADIAQLSTSFSIASSDSIALFPLFANTTAIATPPPQISQNRGPRVCPRVAMYSILANI